jgi:hypothetical protein
MRRKRKNRMRKRRRIRKRKKIIKEEGNEETKKRGRKEN